MAPPQHRADAPIVFVWSEDPAWKDDAYKADVDGMPKGEHGEHCVPQYLAGFTRGDLSAPDADGRVASDYLEPDANKVELKRLSLLDVARCRDAGGRVGRLHAARIAYEGDVDELFADHGAGYVFQLGEFALRCSEAPRPGESKRSGS